jgi:hypothetical protein
MLLAQAPTSGWFTRHVLESPFPLGGVLLGMAAIFAFLVLRNGRTDRLLPIAAVGLAGAAILLIGRLVVTPGEHAGRVTRLLVKAAESGNVAATMAHFAPDALMSLGSEDNPGVGLASIQRLADATIGTQQVESNSIMRLEMATIAEDEGRVELGVLTDIGYGPTPSTWVIFVKPQPDQSWKVAHLALITVNRAPPPADLVR